MSFDPTPFKPRIREYLQKKGVWIKTDEQPHRISCPHPNHSDAHPTAIVYDQTIHCPVCGETWDIFEVAGLLIGVHDFPAKKAEVLRVLGESETPYQPPKRNAPQKPKSAMVPVPMERAKQLYTKQNLIAIAQKDADKKGWGTELVAAWPYKNAQGDVEVVDVRYHGGDREKTVISFFYDGQRLAWANTPVVLYNRDRIAPGSYPILVVEGAKSANGAPAGVKGAESIPGFIPTTWNGGTGKIHLADWSPLKGLLVYFYPDDDRKRYPDDAKNHAGELKPDEDQPGIRAAIKLQEIGKQIGFEVKICRPLEKAREIKDDGADIIEALQILSPEAMAEYIISGPKINEKPTTQAKPPEPPREAKPAPTTDGLPFRILGCADNGRAYFVDRSGHLQIFSLSSLTKTQLLILAPRLWWQNEFPSKKDGVFWDDAIDFVIEIAGRIDFNPENIRGRGAWRESDGRICYHDGNETTGHYSSHRLFLKKAVRPIGIGEPETPPEVRKRIFELACQMSFESKVDVLRCLAWSVLAPFGGALSWRNAIMITGPSSSGKTQIADLLVKMLAMPKMYSGATTTEAGIRQDSPNDSEPVLIEESETDTQNKKRNREAQFTLMRESTSEDTPIGAKGTIDGKGMTYRLRKMFCFIAISPEVDSWADENRMNLVSLVDPKGKHTAAEWSALKKEIKSVLTEESAAGIRSVTWNKLPKIMEMADWLTDYVQIKSGKNSRQSYSESMLLAAYVIVWQGLDEITDDDAIKMIEKFYALQEREEPRDEASEMLTRILDESVFVPNEKRGPGQKMQLREILEIIHTGQIDSADDIAVNGKRIASFGEVLQLRKVAQQFGVGVTKDGHYAISFDHHEIKKILQRGSGYHKVLQRHKDCKERSRTVSMGTGNNSRRCVIIGLVDTPI
jgi:hypothetical protein